MRLHLIYRSCAAENSKPRPGFYSKQLALRSCLASVLRSPWQADITFLNDGELPAELMEIMRPAGQVRQARFGSARRAYFGALNCALHHRGACDFVWFSEDDYLYRPEAFTVLRAAVEHFREVDYLTFYGGELGAEHLPQDVKVATVVEGLRRPLAGNAAVGEWFEVGATTSTFGVRSATLRADWLIHRLAPLSGGSWDNTVMRVVAGRTPYPWSRITRGLSAPNRSVSDRVVRMAGKLPMRAVANLLAWPRRARPHVLAAPLPNLATHMESGPCLASGTDWAALAAQLNANV